MKKIYRSLTEMVGRTPLVEMHKLCAKYKIKAHILGKCEFYNPLFSVKDRIALQMINRAEASGLVNENTIFVEATSGNTGIGLAAICAAKGYKLVITMPENMTKERIDLMKHLGAEVILTPKEDGMKGAIAKANILAQKNKNVILLKQFENEANPEAHKLSTSIEILEDTGGDIDAVVVGVGTGGTLNGIASTLKTYNPDLYVVAVEPKKSPVLKGGTPNTHQIYGIGANFIPKFFDCNLVDEIYDVSDENAINMAKETAKTEGLPVGISAGAALYAAVELGKKQQFAHKNIVVILPDAIERYLSTDLF